MNHIQVIALLKTNQNEKNIELWNQRGSTIGRLKSFGIGLTVLRNLAKQIGRDRDLASKLWDTDIYDAQIIALLIDDPKQITREQAEMQVENLKQEHLISNPVDDDWSKAFDQMKNGLTSSNTRLKPYTLSVNTPIKDIDPNNA